MAVRTTWRPALAWRTSSAELAVRVRREVSRSGEVGRALSDGRDRVRIAWFRVAGGRPRKALGAEVARLYSILDRDLAELVEHDAARK